MLNSEKTIRFFYCVFFVIGVCGLFLTVLALFIKQSETAKIISLIGVSVNSASTILCVALFFLKNSFFGLEKPILGKRHDQI